MTKEEFKYHYPSLTNTEVFYDKAQQLTNYANNTYQVDNNTNVVRSGNSIRHFNNSTRPTLR